MMIDRNASYIKVDGTQVIFTGKYMEVYIPSFYFEKDLTRIIGNLVNTIGVFTFRVFNTDEMIKIDKIRNSTKLNTFNFPGVIDLIPTSQFTKTLELLDDLDEEDSNKQVILQFFENDILIENTTVIKRTGDMIKFMNLINGGKLPNTIAYNKILDLMINASSVSGVELGVTAATIELMLSELCRDPKNINKAFRFKANLANTNMNDYKMNNIRKIAALNSTFTAVTFEDFNTALTYSMNKVIDKEEETISPVEEVIKY